MLSSNAKPVLFSLLLVGAAAASCGDQNTERRGGSALPDLTAGGGDALPGAGSGAAGTNEGGAAGTSSTPPAAFCDAYAVINCVCQQCHQNPPLNGAPIPLVTYEDTQAPFPLQTSSRRVWQAMQSAVTSDFMPYTGDPKVMPPVQPLTVEQKRTLLTWLMEGAKAEGGSDCPKNCDWAQAPPAP